MSEFLSPRVNKRTDMWGGSPEKRRRFLSEVIKQIRSVTTKKFIVAVKLNSSDFQRGGFSEDDSIVVIKMLEALGIDFIEISGGTYENAEMMQSPHLRDSTRQREAFFIEFAEKVAKGCNKVPLMLTGGFRTTSVMNKALAAGAVSLIGMARPFAVCSYVFLCCVRTHHVRWS